MKQNLLVAGFSTRHVACSAFKAGYNVYALDNFCDQDLYWYTKECFRFDSLDEIEDRIQDICARFSIDAVLVTSGAESAKTPVPLYSTDIKTVSRFLDKVKTDQFFEEIGVKKPAIIQGNEYPAFLKPCSGSGGWRNRVVSSEEEEEEWRILFDNQPYFKQQVIVGTPASVSCISDGKRAVALSSNEQVLRGEGECEYGYSGSITPFCHPEEERLKSLAEYIVARSGCMGAVGVDFLINYDNIYAIEINPRFQATLDTVEAVTGANLVNLHINAFLGEISNQSFLKRCYAVRRILFAERDVIIKEDLKNFAPQVADIPWPGTYFEEGNAIISILAQGKTRDEALASLDTTISKIQQYIG